MRNKTFAVKQVGVICLFLLMALGGIGVSYGKWTQNLDVAAAVTTGAAPAVTTHAATSISSTSATLNGNLSGLGAGISPTVNLFFEYGTSTNYPNYDYTVAATPSSVTSVPQAFSATIIGLSPSTLYHFRAKAVGLFTVYGDDLTFTTSAAPQVVFQYAVSNDPTSTDDPNDVGSWTFTDPADPSSWAWIGSRRNQDKAITLGSIGYSTLTITMTTDSEAPNYDYYPAVAVLVTNTGTAAADVIVAVTKPTEVLVIEQGGILDGFSHSLPPSESMTGYINMEVPRTFPNNTTYTVTLNLTSP